MPLGKKVRPSSAAGKLETFAISSIFQDIRSDAVKPTIPRIKSSQARAKTSIPGTRRGLTPIGWRSQVEQEEHPEWLEWELIKHRSRRHSVGLFQNVATSDNIQKFGDTLKSLRKGKIEQQVSLEHLKSMQAAFEEFENAGRKYLDVEAFKEIMKKCLGFHGVHDQIGELFRKIDYSASGQIDWDEFCTYMQLKYKKIEESNSQSKHTSFALPAMVREFSHAGQILRICYTPDDTFIMMREDGIISFWSAELKLKRTRRLFERPTGRKPKWITDFTIMSQYNKFILSTGDREIQIYELSTLEPYCQVTGLETGPLQLDYCSTGEDDCMILYGDNQGCINILLLTSVGETLRTWKKWPRVDNFPTISIENSSLSPNVTCIRWKVHEDWVTQMKYYDAIGSIISSSNHEATALVIGCTTGTTNVEKQMKGLKECWREGRGIKSHSAPGIPQKRLECDQSVFRVHKGVKTFDFCKKNNLIVTGGIDRIVRMWNPYIPGKPTGLLRGHSAPIFYLNISTDDNKLFSVSTDNTVKIWDIEDQSCLFTANSKASQIKGDVSACHYVPGLKGLCIAADGVALLHLRTEPQSKPNRICSHNEPALCCKYSHEFRQVISCSEGSVIKVWDLDTGKLIFEFSGAHGDSAISCMTFDDSGRRLITGGRDGCLKIWNHNNGHCLRILKKENRCDEICDCVYVEMHKNKYVLAVGWDRRINIYCDSFGDHHHTQLPEPHWQDDLKRGHKDDILCIAQCPPTLLATSSYDGEIIVWNMISGHIYCHLQIPPTVCRAGEAVDKSVNKVTFLKTRVLKADLGASLVATGSQGLLAFWNLFHGGQLFSTFTASKVKSQISSLAVSADDSLLFAADYVGYIYVYSMKDFAIHGPEVDPPKLVNYWRAHISAVTCIELIEEQKLMVTSSLEGTVRLWSMDGEFIGTFGQLEPWEIHAPASWKHPMVPYEILIDPLSMPIHPVLEEETSFIQLSNFEKNEEIIEDTESKDLQHKFSKSIISDDAINEEIRKKTFQNNLGKRLRHERYQSLNKPLKHGGPDAYHTLKYFEIANAPNKCEKPDLSAAGTDPYATLFLKESTCKPEPEELLAI